MNAEKGSENFRGLQKGPGNDLKNPGKYPEKRSDLSGMGKEPLRCFKKDKVQGTANDSLFHDGSSREGLPPSRSKLVIHDLEAAMAQSTVRPRDTKRRGWVGNQQ